MSNARPMSSDRRHTAYGTRPTARQRRQWYRMDMRRRYRDAGTLPPSGASGLPVHRPARHHSWPPERGSIVTHIAAHCAPCDRHHKPRTHRYVRSET